MVMTDSGGLQKEAYFFNKLCLTMRDETEWVELVENGYNKLVGADESRILEGFKSFSMKSVSFSSDLYGGGKAAENICNSIIEAIG